MDSFGVVGVYQHITLINAGGMRVDDVLPRLKKRYDGLTYKKSKSICRGDYDYIVGYFKRVVDELGK